MQGRVIGLAGEPVAEAVVTARNAVARTDDAGVFEILLDAAHGASGAGSWITVTHPNYLNRTRAGVPGDPVLFRLTPDDGQTVALQFGGDVMTGRRFFDPDENGDRADAVIDDPADVAAHRALLEPISPLLADADLTAVNVESPISAQPFIDPNQPRRRDVHPTKDHVFASGTGLPQALADSGVDVIGLANNHQFDLLDAGVRSTVDGFTAAGFAPGSRQFGLGPTIDAAYVPAIAEAGPLRIAFLGCTSVVGSEHDVGYVAQPDRGGAAPCDEARIRDSVAAAASASDLVVFSVHGGFEYSGEPSGRVRGITAVAREAGANLVINHHPHVVGGLDWDGRTLAAWSMGNLVFDQTVWPTLQSYVLAVHVRRGEIVRAYLEPVMIDDYVAHGIGSDRADHIARTAAGLSTGPFVVEDGAVELDLAGSMTPQVRTVPLTGSEAGTVTEVGDGWLLDRADPDLSDFGTDLLWAGDFGDDVLDGGPGALWLDGPDRAVVTDPAAPERGGTYQIRRDDSDIEPIFGSTVHRLLLTNPGSVAIRRSRSGLGNDDPASTAPAPVAAGVAEAQLTLVARTRVSAGAQAEVRLAWYSDTRGPSSSQTVHIIEPSDGEWRSIRLDASAPPDAVAVAVLIRLAPPTLLPGGPQSPPEATVGVDDVRLIEWTPRGSAPTQAITHIRTFGTTQAALLHAGTAEQEPMLIEIGR